MGKRKLDRDKFEKIVIAHYLKEGKAAFPEDIAYAADCSLSTVYKVVRDGEYDPKKGYTYEWSPGDETEHWCGSGSRRTTGWAPSLETLRVLLNGALLEIRS